MDKLSENAGLVKPEDLKAEDFKAGDFKAEALEAPAPDLLSMGEKGLGAEIEKLGFPRYRAGQIWRQMLAGTSDFSEMTDLPLAMRQTLAERYVTGVPAIEQVNKEKAALLYDAIDNSRLFHGTADPAHRSLMNVTFVTGDKDLDARFVSEAAAKGLVNLKGHRLVGGIRASIYNAMPIEGVRALVDFMKEFEAHV